LSEIGLKKGIIINFIAKYSNIFLQLLITSILARILTPKEFGIISIIMIFITFFNLLGDMGIGPAVIQYKDLKDNDISSIFIFTFFIAVFLSLIFFIFSYLISYIYKNSIYIQLGHLLCFTIIFNVLSIVPNGLQLKNKQFKIVGISNLISNLISGIVTIVLAYIGFSYYSLVLNSIIQSIINFFILFYFSKIKISISNFSFIPVKRISSFSLYQFLFNLVNYFSRNGDNLLIGKFLGMDALGYYDKAYRLMLYPIQGFTYVITPVLQPILSDYKDKKDIVLMHYKKIVKILALIGIFLSVFCFFSAKEIIVIMFGQQWIECVTSFKILSVSIVIQMVLSSSGSIFQAIGNTKQLFISGVIGSSITILMIVIGIKLGKIEFVAFDILIAYILNFIQTYYILIKKVFKKDIKVFFIYFKSIPIIAVLSALFFQIFSFSITNIFLSLLIKLIIGSISFIVGLIITKEYVVFISVFKSKNA